MTIGPMASSLAIFKFSNEYFFFLFYVQPNLCETFNFSMFVRVFMWKTFAGKCFFLGWKIQEKFGTTNECFIEHYVHGISVSSIPKCSYIRVTFRILSYSRHFFEIHEREWEFFSKLKKISPQCFVTIFIFLELVTLKIVFAAYQTQWNWIEHRTIWCMVLIRVVFKMFTIDFNEQWHKQSAFCKYCHLYSTNTTHEIG